MLAFLKKKKIMPPPGGLEPPTFRLTAERANQLRHGGMCPKINNKSELYLTSEIVRVWVQYFTIHHAHTQLKNWPCR